MIGMYSFDDVCRDVLCATLSHEVLLECRVEVAMSTTPIVALSCPNVYRLYMFLLASYLLLKFVTV